MNNNNPSLDPVDVPDGDTPLSLAEYKSILDEIDNQPRQWRRTADKEMDYADGNQLKTELLEAQRALGIPPAMENLIAASLEGIRGYEESTRTDWRVTPNGQPGGQDVADAINFKINEAERNSKADDACSAAFYPQIAVGMGWVEVSRGDDPFAYEYQCIPIHRNEIHWDWSALKSDLSDARWLRRQRWLHPSRVASVFPEHKKLVRQFGRAGINWWSSYDQFEQGGASTGLSRDFDVAREWTTMEDRWYNPVSREICISELWYRRWSDVIVLKSPDGRVVEYDENNPAHVHAIANNLVRYRRVTVPKVRRSYWMGPHLLFDGPSQYAHRHFPYVPFWGFREDSTRVPFGYVRNMLYQQDTLNSGTSRLRWGMSAYRVERTDGAVDMPDDVFRRTVGRLDADIVLSASHMAQPGARFKVERDFQMNAQQLEVLQNARQAIERVNPAAAGAFSGRRGTATSGVQEQTQVEQANQSLAYMMGNFRRGRTQVGELLMSMIVQDMGTEEHTIIIEGDAVREDRSVTINKVETDPVTGIPYLSNDLQRTRLLVSLEDVPSSSSFRAQQLHALSEAVKSLPPQYQAAAMPFMASMMDLPFKRELVESFREAGGTESPEAVEKRVREEVANELKNRELDLKAAKNEAEIKKIVADAVQSGIAGTFAAMQAGEKIALNPMIAPIGDIVMKQAGWQAPNPVGQDPNIPAPEQAQMVQYPGGLPGDTDPLSPQPPMQPQSPSVGAEEGIETLRAD